MSTLKIYAHTVYGDVVLASEAHALEQENAELRAALNELFSKYVGVASDGGWTKTPDEQKLLNCCQKLLEAK